METHIQRKIRARGNLRNHLKQMNYLTLVPIEEKDLFSIEDTDNILEEYRKHRSSISCKFLFAFDNAIIQNVKDELLKLDFTFYLISEFSFDSGLLRLETLNQFNTMFNFSDLEFYRVTLLDINLDNEVTFWEENNNGLEIEIRGNFFLNYFENRLGKKS